MNFKKFIPFCLTVLALGLASCGDDTTTSSTGEQAHQHTYATEWSKDSTHHWHPCTGTDCGVYKDRAAHHGGEATCTAAAVCEDCGESYGSLKAHTFDQEVADAKYLKAEATHAAKATYFKSCTCGEKGTETFEHGTTVEHTKAESWSKDATNHWKGCTATGCENIKLDSAAHVYDQEVVHADYLKDAATCLADAVYFKSCICGAKGEATFTAANSKLAHDYDLTTYGLKTAEGHAHVCKTEGCNAHDTVAAHSTTEGTCEACGYVSHTHSWQETLTAGTDTHWIKCNSCDEKKPESEVAHTYENQGTTVTQNANCTLPQLTKKTCDCGAEHASETWESAPANGHDATGEWIEDATAGNHYKECAHCEGKAETAAHAYTEEVVDAKYLKSAATCTTAATYYKSCVCGAKGTDATFTSGQASHVNGYYITVEVSGATKYLVLMPNGADKAYVELSDNPVNIWTYNTEYNTFQSKLSNGVTFYMGTYKTFTTFSASAISYATTSFVSQLYSTAGTVVTEWSTNTTYKIGVVQKNLNNDIYYFTGAKDGNFWAGNTSFATGANVKVLEAYMSDETNHWFGCLNCDYVKEGTLVAHSGGTATCNTKANCSVCGTAYGTTLEHVYSDTLTDLGNTHGYKCTTEGCNSVKDEADHDTTTGTCVCGKVAGATSTIVFDFGAAEPGVYHSTNNGTQYVHADGKEISAGKSYSSGAYNLVVSTTTKVYDGAFDEKGNSCIKFGTSKVAGSMTFTAPANVSKVVVYASGYKNSTGKVTINGKEYTLSTKSNTGEYTKIEIDTSSNKTVTISTSSSSYRIMINTIEFVAQ